MSRCKSSSPGTETFITVMAVAHLPEEMVKENLGQCESFLGKNCCLNYHLYVTVQ